MELQGLNSSEVMVGAGFAMAQRVPGGALRGLVRRITAYATDGALPGLMVEPASLVVPLIFVFEGGFDLAFRRSPVASDRQAGFLAGLTAVPVRIATPLRTACLQVDFTPLGAMRFFGPVLAETADLMVGHDDFGDPFIRDLGARLGACNDWAARMALAEASVAGRLAAGPALPAELARAWRLIEASGGRARIERIADHVGWSRRTLSARFRRETGMTPKTAARIARFARADRLAQASARPDWAAIAAECGYADQSHLVREFADLAGTSPAHRHAA